MQNLRKIGIEIISSAPWSTHFCQFYQTRQDLLDILTPYFQSGLEENEFCMLITSDPLDNITARDAFKKTIPGFEKYLEQGQIEILPYTDWYLKDGCFDAERVLNGWAQKLDSALKQGYAGLRLSGNTFWLESSGWNSFYEYEAAVTRVISKHNMLALCTYCLDKCSGTEVIDVLKNHEFALIKKDNQWELIESAVNKKTKEELEQRVKSRTAALEKLNHALNEEIVGHRQAREQISAIASSFRNLIENSADGILIISNQGIIRFANPAAEKIISCKNVELIGKTFSFPLAADDQTEIEIIQGDSSAVSIEMSVTETEWEGERCFLSTLRDITARKNTEDALRKSKTQFESLFNTMAEGVALIDTGGTVIKANRAMEQITGLSLQQIEGSHYAACGKGWQNPDNTAVNLQDMPVSRVLAGRKTVKNVEIGMERFDGTIVWLSANAIPILDNNGNLEGVVRTLSDITERKRMEDVIKQNEDRLRLMLDQMPSQLWVTDTNLVFTLSLGAGLQAFNLKTNQLVGTTLFAFYKTENPEFYPILAHRQALQGEPASYELHWEGKILSCYVEPMRDKTNNIIGVIGTSFDITDKTLAEDALRALSRRLVDIQENERRNIARELHDEIGQSLTALKLMMTQGTRSIKTPMPPSLIEAQTTLTELIRQVREMSLKLRPSMLDDLGLLPTLIWYIERYTAQTQIKVDFEHSGLNREFSSELNTAIYRIVQEALTNVARHAGVKEVSVRTWADEKNIYLRIEDRGCGFTASELSSSTSTGISGMRERVLSLGGRLNIETSPGRGTCLTAELPVKVV